MEPIVQVCIAAGLAAVTVYGWWIFRSIRQDHGGNQRVSAKEAYEKYLYSLAAALDELSEADRLAVLAHFRRHLDKVRNRLVRRADDNQA